MIRPAGCVSGAAPSGTETRMRRALAGSVGLAALLALHPLDTLAHELMPCVYRGNMSFTPSSSPLDSSIGYTAAVADTFTYACSNGDHGLAGDFNGTLEFARVQYAVRWRGTA
jgi:hypothetical protein